VETVSLDTPGIVQAITAVLRDRGFNIEELESLTEAAPWTGAPLFKMKVRVTAPSGTRLAALREALARTAEEHDLDVTVRPLTSVTAEI
jgi:glycine cleavage system transcriptional repressor